MVNQGVTDFNEKLWAKHLLLLALPVRKLNSCKQTSASVRIADT